jgi:hypothetical protein
MKENNMRLPIRVAVAILLLFSGFFGAFAQEAIAVHPLSDDIGSPMTVVFLEELIKAIPRVPGYSGAYRPYSIDLVNNRPSDVPPGGFPPYICPSPSLTAGSAYAMTGEVGADKDNPGSYWVRIYLWNMDNGRLIVSDMVNASDRESCAASYPYVLAYLFSVVDENKIALQGATPEQSQTVYRPTNTPKTVWHWLNLGLSAGAGNSSWDGLTDTGFMNVSMAFHAGVNILTFLTVQAEANLNGHFDAGNFEANFWHVSVPLLLKINLRNDPVKASLNIGPYLFFPLPSETTDNDIEFYKLLGISYGLTVGWKIGPGYIFADGRMNHLLFFSDDGLKYPSNAAVFSIGYEIPLIRKKTP